MSGQRIDWRRAKHPKYNGSPACEISDRDALDDQLVLSRTAEREKKAREAVCRKLPRSLKERRKLAVLEKAINRPDRADELRLRAILASGTLKPYGFEVSPYLPISDRTFISQNLKIRVVIDRNAKSAAATIRADSREKFDWLLVKLTTQGVMQEGSMIAIWIADICSSQSKLRSGKRA